MEKIGGMCLRKKEEDTCIYNLRSKKKPKWLECLTLKPPSHPPLLLVGSNGFKIWHTWFAATMAMRVSCPPWHICFWTSSHDRKFWVTWFDIDTMRSFAVQCFQHFENKSWISDSVNSNHNAKLSKIFVCLKNEYSFILTFFEQFFFLTWLHIHAFYLPPNIFTIHGAHHLSLSLKKLAISKTAWNWKV